MEDKRGERAFEAKGTVRTTARVLEHRAPSESGEGWDELLLQVPVGPDEAGVGSSRQV